MAGQPCPVCDQTVATLPTARPAADLTSADAVVAAEQARQAEAAERERVGKRNRLADEIERLCTVLAGAPPSAAAIDEALAGLDALATAAEQAATALRDARRRRDDAADSVHAIRSETTAAALALGRARDPLVSFGAPVADDVLAGWRGLCAWAGQEARVRGAALADARVAAADAAEVVQAAKLAFEQVERTAIARRGEETVATRAEQRARSDLDALDQRIEQLHAALDFKVLVDPSQVTNGEPHKLARGVDSPPRRMPAQPSGGRSSSRRASEGVRTRPWIW